MKIKVVVFRHITLILMNIFEAINENLTSDEIIDYARQQGDIKIREQFGQEKYVFQRHLDTQFLRTDFRLLSSEGLITWLRTVADTINSKKPALVFRQLYESESSTYTYLLADKDSGNAEQFMTFVGLS